ncbi:HIT family protein [endosymbiont GvMRE of Glomus versiforme]|uniref:HIT family protein n=1 Tax=endosymbiont GvMRE of Glomus versiforme TaxID=2039283 RepID=UPI000EDB2BD0|nr:HIT family protein [endosymbiont GvMRE of Glomus versiforme]RHZ35607.1 Histidine triad (HIT) protein [endosymbiont GvMRE of Glomus versiforme]
MRKICPFCQIVEKQVSAYIIAEDSHCLSFLDINPASEGHILIITKRCAKNIIGLKQADWNSILPLLKKVVRKIQKTFPGVQGFNFISNMNEDIKKQVAYQSIPHFHIHIIPKYKKNKGFIWKIQKEKKINLDELAKKMKVKKTIKCL